MRHCKRLHARLVVCVGLVAALLPVALTADGAMSIEGLLHQWSFSAADVRTVAAGKAVVKGLDTAVRQELAYFGAVHIDGAASLFVERLRDIERFERGPSIPQIGRFSVPPRLEDLASLKLPVDDVMSLSACRPGACDLKLSATSIARFQHEVPWASSSAAAQADRLARQTLLDLVRAYQTNGNAALGSYDDDRQTLEVAEQFRSMLASSGPTPLPIPELTKYLVDYPRSRPAGSEEFFYWSVVNFGLKPTIRLNHVIIYPLIGQPSGVSYAIAIKQLYASHYFQTALDLRLLVDDRRRAETPGFYLLSLTRSRIDGTSGLKGSLLRPLISRRSRNGVRDYMDHLKQEFESGSSRPLRDGARTCAAPGGGQICLDTP